MVNDIKLKVFEALDRIDSIIEQKKKKGEPVGRVLQYEAALERLTEFYLDLVRDEFDEDDYLDFGEIVILDEKIRSSVDVFRMKELEERKYSYWNGGYELRQVPYHTTVRRAS